MISGLRSRWSKIINLSGQHETKIRFLLAGGLNTVVGLAMYPVLYFVLVRRGLNYMTILLISQSLCIVFAYITNKYFVFRTDGHYITEFIKFTTFHMGYLLLNLAALPAMVEWLHMNPVIAQTLFAILVIVSSYFWHSSITFSRSHKSQ